MKISFSENFYELLVEIIGFIATDKPKAASKFKKELIVAKKRLTISLQLQKINLF